MVSGTEAKFRVEATGDDLQFQWQKNYSNIYDDRWYDSKYCGTDTNTLHIRMVKKGDEGHYRCLVKDYVEKVASNDAVLTVSKLVLTSYTALYVYTWLMCVWLLERSIIHNYFTMV